MKAHSLLGLMLLLLALQAVGHVALRLAAAGGAGAVRPAVGAGVEHGHHCRDGGRARAQPNLALACAGRRSDVHLCHLAAAQLMLFAMAPQAALKVLPIALLGMALCGGLGTGCWRALAPRRTGPRPEADGRRGPLRMRGGVVAVADAQAVAVAVSWAREQFGSSGLYGAVALARLPMRIHRWPRWPACRRQEASASRRSRGLLLASPATASRAASRPSWPAAGLRPHRHRRAGAALMLAAALAGVLR